jgi:hypothetical protein
VDKGWVYDEARETWLLLSRAGLVIRSYADELIEQVGFAQLNRFGVRQGWPELVPHELPTHCVLFGGPMDGRHLFFPPDRVGPGGPPDMLWYDPDGPDASVYRRQPLDIGRPDVWPYRWAGP